MKILITGASGQLGMTLKENFQDFQDFHIYAPDRNEFNLSDKEQVIENYIYELDPDWIINCAAYTAVDKAEDEPDIAHKINALGPKSISKALKKKKGKMIQISTDFVFSGKSSIAYRPEFIPDPISKYGKTKAEGEKYVTDLLQDRSHIIRTSWLYSSIGRNFLLTMLNLHKTKGINCENLRVVFDQISCPTSTKTLSKFILEIILSKNLSIPHILHWSDQGVCSWYDFAFEIGSIASQNGLIKKTAFIEPISSSEYNCKAKRPNFSLLDSTYSWSLFNGSKYWKTALYEVIDELKNF